MRHFTLLITVLILNLGALSQAPVQFIEFNNTRAIFYGTGLFGYDAVNSAPSYEVPKGAGTHTLYALSPIWTAESNGTLFGGDIRFNPTATLSGPVSNQYNTNWYPYYQQIFQVNSSQVNNHINNFNQTGYTVPQNIQNWPAEGNVNGGTGLFIAPFEDVDNNNQYNPENGDYPIVRGDRCYYHVFNFDSIPNPTSVDAGEHPLEVHQSTYQYSSTDEKNNTTFIHYRVVNRGDSELTDYQFGLFMDFDLGYISDDYIGTDSTRNMAYVYNSDNNDGHYGTNPPAFGVELLNKNLSVTQLIGPNSNQNYTSLSSLDLMMDGFLSNGSSLTNSSGNPIQMVYKGDPNVSNSESEYQFGLQSGDKKMLLSVEPVSLQPGESACYDFALVYAQGSDHLNSVTELQTASDNIQQFYDNQNFNCWTPPTSVGINEKKANNKTRVYPNPFMENVTIKSDQKMKHIAIYDMSGRALQNIHSEKFREQIATDHFSPGIYILKITYQSGSTHTLKVTKK